MSLARLQGTAPRYEYQLYFYVLATTLQIWNLSDIYNRKKSPVRYLAVWKCKVPRAAKGNFEKNKKQNGRMCSASSPDFPQGVQTVWGRVLKDTHDGATG